MKDRRQSLEAILIRSFNMAFLKANRNGVPFVLEHLKGRPQYCDMLVLAPDRRGLAIECKRVSSRKPLYFSHTFHEDGKGKSQVVEMDRFLGASGLKGLLAVEFYPKGAEEADIVFLPWKIVSNAYNSESASIDCWNHIYRMNLARQKAEKGFIYPVWELNLI